MFPILVCLLLALLLQTGTLASAEEGECSQNTCQDLLRRIEQLEAIVLKIQSSIDVPQQTSVTDASWINACKDVKQSGLYNLRSIERPVFCEMDVYEGDWVVIQQRLDGSVSFNRSWSEYRDGFGTVGNSTEFWLGLEAIHRLTKNGHIELTVEVKDELGQYKFAQYANFSVSGEESYYRLASTGEYSNSSTLKNKFALNRHERFATYDNDDLDDCGRKYGAGWWFYQCRINSYTLLNGPYVKDENTGQGIYWSEWTDAASYSRMMIRIPPTKPIAEVDYPWIDSCSVASESGLYNLRLIERPVFCEMDVYGGGWLVIQQRLDGSVDFNRTWSDYRDGFGTVSNTTEFWLGLEAIHQLTKNRHNKLTVQMRSEYGHYKFAQYSEFAVASEDDSYKLAEVEYNTSISTLRDMLFSGRHEEFATHDVFHFASCPEIYGGGWWYSYECGYINLNGPYVKDNNTGRGIFWSDWTDAAKYSRMMIKLAPPRQVEDDD